MTRRTLLTDHFSDALFSECGRYRYALIRRWGRKGDGACTRGRLVMLMLNPSKAGKVDNDATVTRQITRAQRLGFSELVVVNAFALVSTDPGLLKKTADPIGPKNDATIRLMVDGADMVVVAWGKVGSLRGRADQVLAMLRDMGIKLHALRINGDGTPEHPLYIPYECEPVAYDGRPAG